LTVGGSVTGIIDSDGDRDWFRTTLTAGNQYTIDLEGSPTSAGTLSDPYLRGIYDSSGNIISGTTNDDGGTVYNSQVIYTPTSNGTYYISAGAYGSNMGTYTLRLAGEAPAGITPTDIALDNSTIAENDAGAVVGTLSVTDSDIDDTHTLTISGTDSDQFEIVNNQLKLLSTVSADYETQSSYELTVTATDSFGKAYSESFTIGVTDDVDETAPDLPETTDTPATLTAGGSVTGIIDSNGDRDWFSTTLTAGNQYTIDLEGSPTSAGTLSDPFLRGIYDSSGTPISGTTNDDGGTAYNSQVTYTPTSNGTYYISAGAYSTNTGTYTLSLAEEVISTDSTTVNTGHSETTDTTATLIVGGSATGTIDSNGDRDWFRTTLTAGNRYIIDLEGSPTGAGTLVDTFLRGIYDSSGNIISGTTNDDGGTGYNSQVSYTPTSSDDYFIAAGAYGTGTGTYTLSLTEAAPIVSYDDSNLEPGETRSWNVMVYIAADNNLESFGLDDINEMEAATGSGSSDVYVTALIDRIDGFSSADGDWTDTRRGQIVSDSSTSTISSNLASLGELNTGDPNTLTDFINWSATNYPAENHALVIWNHGGGYDGAAWDDTNGGDNLTLSEVTSAIDSSIIERFGVVGYDACLMAMVEAVYPVANYTDYFVASSELEPGAGWEYTGLMNSLFANPQMSAQSLGSTMVEDYTNQFSANSYSEHTLSSINTDHVETLFDSLNEFSTTVIDTASTADWDAIIAAHDATTTYGYA
nr:clostripain-related cysteine peptidase [Pseudomonadales bacterium]